MYADMRWQNLEREDNDVGFVDPYVIYKHPNPPKDYKPQPERNLMNFLVNQRDKKEILFPYNFKWVLL